MHNCALVVMGFDADFARAIFMDKLVLCQCGESGKYSPHHSPFKLVIGDVANGESEPSFSIVLVGITEAPIYCFYCGEVSVFMVITKACNVLMCLIVHLHHELHRNYY